MTDYRLQYVSNVFSHQFFVLHPVSRTIGFIRQSFKWGYTIGDWNFVELEHAALGKE